MTAIIAHQLTIEFISITIHRTVHPLAFCSLFELFSYQPSNYDACVVCLSNVGTQRYRASLFGCLTHMASSIVPESVSVVYVVCEIAQKLSNFVFIRLWFTRRRKDWSWCTTYQGSICILFNRFSKLSFLFRCQHLHLPF
jgi:hypothetical protein